MLVIGGELVTLGGAQSALLPLALKVHRRSSRVVLKQFQSPRQIELMALGSNCDIYFVNNLGSSSVTLVLLLLYVCVRACVRAIEEDRLGAFRLPQIACSLLLSVCSSISSETLNFSYV